MSKIPIKGTKTTTETVTVEVYPSDAFQMVAEALMNKYDLKGYQWIQEDGYIWEEEDCGPHRPRDKRVRLATPIQSRVMAAITEINALLRG